CTLSFEIDPNQHSFVNLFSLLNTQPLQFYEESLLLIFYCFQTPLLLCFYQIKFLLFLSPLIHLHCLCFFSYKIAKSIFLIETLSSSSSLSFIFLVITLNVLITQLV